MQVSVIFTTYNHPNWLEKTLWGFSCQSFRDFEIIVADDGSTADTKAVVEKVRTQTDIPIKHIWQEDDGFQKCKILNKAIVESQGNYLIFTDGDCIPHPDFVKNHVELSAENTLLSGGYFKLPLELSRKITRQDILVGNSTNPSWLRKNGLPFTLKISKLYSHPIIGAILDALTFTRATWNGHSASTWKKYVLQTNGFDERMQYGGQDREFGERLVNMGLRTKQVRYRCSCVHLDHGRGYARPESIAKNRKIRDHTGRNKITRTDYGIDSTGKADATSNLN
ncbi:MAG: glycosyltransferase involved in cell wall biosynthesis [Gammaproteobacteria bacterium]|jgi:glycosyltransferase involved in cell wall biosynthesis